MLLEIRPDGLDALLAHKGVLNDLRANRIFQARHGHNDRSYILLAASRQTNDQEHDRQKHFQHKIFLPAQAVFSVHEGITGTGLGLAIARDLAELMGGMLKLVAADKGAVFELRLPAPK